MKAAYRTEKDTMGEIIVPASALWGAQTQRARENFQVSGMLPRREYIWAIAAIKHAAAKVHAELGLLEEAYAEAIQQAAEEVMRGQWDEHFVVDPFQAGAGTSHNMNANEVIANRATMLLGGKPGEYIIHPNDHVNMSQSTNDVIPSAIRLGCLYRLTDLQRTIVKLERAMTSKAVEFDDVIKSGRTHLQDAVPIRLGQEFGAYAHALHLDSKRIERAAGNLRTLGIGGSATGTGLNVHPGFHQRMVKRLADLTGLPLYPAENLFERMQSMADMTDFSAALRTLAVTITRIANDLRLLSSGPATGLNEISLPAVQPGSSIMPGKVNPVMAEMVNMAMYHLIGNDTAILLASQAGQLELNVMMPVIAHNLFEMIQITIGALDAFTTRCVAGIKANSQKALTWLHANAAIVTALNPLIGYAAGAELAKEASASGQSLPALAKQKAEEGLLSHVHEKRKIAPAEVEQVFKDLRSLTEGGLPPKPA